MIACGATTTRIYIYIYRWGEDKKNAEVEKAQQIKNANEETNKKTKLI